MFDGDRTFLGELQTRDGAFGCVLLSREGERQLGDRFSTWQVRGLPIADETFVQLRNRAFFDAACRWLHAHGFTLDICEPHEAAARYAEYTKIPVKAEGKKGRKKK
ncbi:hypothetical protein HY479_00305 [Candidatus Uhrbacteria bacterium]|nr:hypothetical protein [Candidatus Uhrbacteria bacterium]